MRRLQLSFPTLLFGLSFVLCIVVALLFLDRGAKSDADAAAARAAAKSRQTAANTNRNLASTAPADPLPASNNPGYQANAAAPQQGWQEPYGPGNAGYGPGANPNGQAWPQGNEGYPPAGAYAPNGAPPAGYAQGYGAPGPGGYYGNPYAPAGPQMAYGNGAGQAPWSREAPAIAVPPEFRTPVPTQAPQATPAVRMGARYWLPTYTNSDVKGTQDGGGIAGVTDPRLLASLPKGVAVPTRRSGVGPTPTPDPTFGGASTLTNDPNLAALSNANRPFGTLPSVNPSTDPSASLSQQGNSTAESDLPWSTAGQPLPSPAPRTDKAAAGSPNLLSDALSPRSLNTVRTPAASSPQDLTTMARSTPAEPRLETVSNTLGPGTGDRGHFNVPDSKSPGMQPPDVQKALEKLGQYSGGGANATAPVPTSAVPLISPASAHVNPLATPTDWTRPAGAADPGAVAGKTTLPPGLEGVKDPNVMARVGNRTLTPKEAGKRVDVLLRLKGEKADDDRRRTMAKQVAEEWAEKASIVAEANRRGIVPTDDEVKQFTERARKNVGGSRFEDAMHACGFSDQEIKAEMRESAQCEKLIDTIVRQKYDDAKLKAVYDAAPSMFQVSPRVRVIEIVKQRPADPAAAKDAERQIADLQKQASGADEQTFRNLAQTKSDSPDRSGAGQDRWLDYHNMTPVMADVLGQLKPGQVSKVIAEPDGYKVYRVLEVQQPAPGFQGAKELVLDSLKITERSNLLKASRQSGGVYIAHLERGGGASAAKPDTAASLAANAASRAAGRAPARSSASAPRRGSSGPDRSSDMSGAVASLGTGGRRDLKPVDPNALEHALGSPDGENLPIDTGAGRSGANPVSKITDALFHRGSRSSATASPGAAGTLPLSSPGAPSATGPAPSLSAPATDMPAGFGGLPNSASANDSQQRTGSGLRGVWNRLRGNGSGGAQETPAAQ